MAKSIERGKFETEFCGARFSGAYCEVVIGDSPHIVDFRMVPGYSSLDHMADVRLAAMVKAISGRTFSSRAAVEKATSKAGQQALPGGPRIDMVLTEGRLAQRWREINLAVAKAVAAKRAAKHDGKVGNFYREFQEGDLIVVAFLAELTRSGYPGRILVATEDNIEEPDAAWHLHKVVECGG